MDTILLLPEDIPQKCFCRYRSNLARISRILRIITKNKIGISLEFATNNIESHEVEFSSWKVIYLISWIYEEISIDCQRSSGVIDYYAISRHCSNLLDIISWSCRILEDDDIIAFYCFSAWPWYGNNLNICSIGYQWCHRVPTNSINGDISRTCRIIERIYLFLFFLQGFTSEDL